MRLFLALLVAITFSFSAMAQRDWRQTQMAETMDSGTMIEHNGVVYAVAKTHLIKFNFETFEILQRLDLVSVGRTPEEEAKQRKEWIDRYDDNDDGVIDDIDDAWRWAGRWLDENKDGKVTQDEAHLDNPPIATDKAMLRVWKNKLVMLRSGHIYRFNLETLELEKTLEIAPPEPEEEDEEEQDDKQDGKAKKTKQNEDVF